jgi:glycosyltransferase involved in cell wall biosynthesis
LKIIVVNTPIFKVPVSGYSGLEVIAWQQAAGLAAKGHQVAMIAADGSECPGVQILPIGPERQTDERVAYDRYWQALLEADVVLDHSWQKWSVNLKLEGRLKAPVLMWMHAPVDTMYRTLPDLAKPCFVCISEDQAKHFEGIHGREARVCYNGVDLQTYSPVGIPRSERYLFLARFSRVKSPLLAIEACRTAGVGMDLVGDTSITNEPDYLRECVNLCDGKQLKMVGNATRSECVWWFSQAKA